MLIRPPLLALEIPEILMAVFRHCQPLTLSRCCLVSRYWSLNAVDVLWKNVPLRALVEAPLDYRFVVGNRSTVHGLFYH